MKSAERVKYFYETVISENQIERMAEFISPECCVKMGEKLISVGMILQRKFSDRLPRWDVMSTVRSV